MKKEALLDLWVNSAPSARFPSLNDNSMLMWLTYHHDDFALFTSPGKVVTQDDAGKSMEVDGVHYFWRSDNAWTSDCLTATFAQFAESGPAKSMLPFFPPKPAFSDEFDWSYRVSGTALILPFMERVPRQEDAKAITNWVKSNSDNYVKKFVRMYHGTDPTIPVEEQGLKPTSATRRRSIQSESGYVYLANTPSRADNFGRLGNSNNSVVYEALVDISKILPDMDQLNNQRSVGTTVGNTIGESIVYGGGVRVKGKIEPWAIRRLTKDEVEQIEARNRRVWLVDHLQDKPGVMGLFAKCAQDALAVGSGSIFEVDWKIVERSTIVAAVNEGFTTQEIKDALISCSPVSTRPADENKIERYINQALREKEFGLTSTKSASSVKGRALGK